MSVSRHFTQNDQLTPREEEVLRLLAQGLSHREVAAELKIKLSTLGTHIGHIHDKYREVFGLPSDERLYRFLYRKLSKEMQNGEKDAHDHEYCEQVISRASKKQKEVLCAFAEGLIPKEVVKRLHLAPGTINTHLGALLQYCRQAWNLPDGDKRVNYIFLYQKFSGYIDRLRAEIERA